MSRNVVQVKGASGSSPENLKVNVSEGIRVCVVCLIFRLGRLLDFTEVGRRVKF